jgi:23S rRNA pseudouridine1911/1915/1917 synthase
MNQFLAYEDDELLIFDKPQGLATASGKEQSLCDKVMQQYPQLSSIKGYNAKEGSLLNRLDNETGGLVLFAKSQAAFDYYQREMQSHGVKKIYSAVVYGTPSPLEGEINFSIVHHPKNQKKMQALTKECQRYKGRPQEAHTLYRVVESWRDYSLLELSIDKGVRHQLRVHLYALNHPIVFDSLYLPQCPLSKVHPHLLYASGLEFTDPLGHSRKIQITACWLKDLPKLLDL